MTAGDGALDRGSLALFTDLYELTMLQAYADEQLLRARDVRALRAHTLPPGRNFLLAAGLEDALRYLEDLSFDDEALAELERLGFPRSFLDWLGGLRFEGDVYAVREGTPVFAGEPLLTVEAPLPQAQLVETYSAQSDPPADRACLEGGASRTGRRGTRRRRFRQQARARDRRRAEGCPRGLPRGDGWHLERARRGALRHPGDRHDGA